MHDNEILSQLYPIIDEILECGIAPLSEHTLLMQDLACESIDLLEISARVAQKFHIRPDDDAMFLRSLRSTIEEAGPGAEPEQTIAKAFPWLSPARVQRLAASLSQKQPLLTLGDIASYIAACRQGSQA